MKAFLISSLLAFSLPQAAVASSSLPKEVANRVIQGSDACAAFMASGTSTKTLKSLGFKGFMGNMRFAVKRPNALARTEIVVGTQGKRECFVSVNIWTRSDHKEAFKIAGKSLVDKGFTRKSRKINSTVSEQFFQLGTQKVSLRFVSSGYGSSQVTFERQR
ncbi:hypothetical protein [uncultured Shimia sp.]|uniref:hypothetical protein n=1 Tax=uncultured Shimia sp. TaxID=573152 RepID=UPI002630BB76|nr:hypothetical protein [uncultured Shimia sp.]